MTEIESMKAQIQKLTNRQRELEAGQHRLEESNARLARALQEMAEGFVRHAGHVAGVSPEEIEATVQRLQATAREQSAAAPASGALKQ